MAQDRLYKITYLELFRDFFLLIIAKQISEFFISQIFVNLQSSINLLIFSIKNPYYNLTLFDPNTKRYSEKLKEFS